MSLQNQDYKEFEKIINYNSIGIQARTFSKIKQQIQEYKSKEELKQ